MGYQVVLSPSARGDLREVARYIALDDRTRAITFSQFLISSAKRLSEQPEMGRVVPEFHNRSVREIVVRAYRIIYRVDHGRREINIVRFWHGARGTPTLD